MRAINLATTFLLLGCSTLPTSTDLGVIPSVARHTPELAARSGVAAQVAAWNRGDLESALLTYWNSPHMTWVSRSGVQRGFASFAEGMRTDFANSEEMGTYSAEVLDARTLGREDALIVFRWQIVRDGRRLMGGTSTQVWRKIGGSWFAVFEHAS
jgi:hypothetical protein